MNQFVIPEDAPENVFFVDSIPHLRTVFENYPGQRIHVQLSLKDNALSTLHFEGLIKLLARQNAFLHLDLERTQLGDWACSFIGHLLSRENLVLYALNLAANSISDVGLEQIVSVFGVSSLSGINLRFNNIGDAGAASLAREMNKQRLSVLLLDGNPIGEAGAIALSRVIPTSRELAVLGLGATDIAPAAPSVLRACARAPALTTLTLSGCTLGRTAAPALAGLISAPLPLRRLQLSGCGLDDGAAAVICGSLGPSRLHELDLSANRLGRGASRSLSMALESNRSLRSLCLRANSMDFSGCKELIETGSRHPTLSRLDLSLNVTGAGDAGQLQEMLGHAGLRSLTVRPRRAWRNAPIVESRPPVQEPSQRQRPSGDPSGMARSQTTTPQVIDALSKPVPQSDSPRDLVVTTAQPYHPEPVVKPQHVQPQHVQPQHVQPQHVQPQHVQPQHVQPQHVQPQHVQPQHVQPQHVQPQHVQPQHVQPQHVQPQHVQPQHVQPQHVQPQHVQPQHVQPQHVQPQHVQPQHVQPQHVQPQHVHPSIPDLAPMPSVMTQPLSPELVPLTHLGPIPAAEPAETRTDPTGYQTLEDPHAQHRDTCTQFLPYQNTMSEQRAVTYTEDLRPKRTHEEPNRHTAEPGFNTDADMDAHTELPRVPPTHPVDATRQDMTPSVHGQPRLHNQQSRLPSANPKVPLPPSPLAGNLEVVPLRPEEVSESDEPVFVEPKTVEPRPSMARTSTLPPTTIEVSPQDEVADLLATMPVIPATGTESLEAIGAIEVEPERRAMALPEVEVEGGLPEVVSRQVRRFMQAGNATFTMKLRTGWGSEDMQRVSLTVDHSGVRVFERKRFGSPAELHVFKFCPEFTVDPANEDTKLLTLSDGFESATLSAHKTEKLLVLTTIVNFMAQWNQMNVPDSPEPPKIPIHSNPLRRMSTADTALI